MQAGTPSKREKPRARSADKPDRPRCTAHKRNGDPCGNPPVRGSNVCRMHGGSAPQVRAKANRRLIAMVLPAMEELHRILRAPDTSDADRLKAINAVLNRTGYAERQEIDLGLREPTEWDALAATILRGSDDDVDPGPLDGEPAPKGLPAGHDDGEDFAQYALEQLGRDRRERDDRVISGRVVDPDEPPGRRRRRG